MLDLVFKKTDFTDQQLVWIAPIISQTELMIIVLLSTFIPLRGWTLH